MARSDAEAAVLGGEVELRGERPFDDEALDPAARALLQEASAPVAHGEVVPRGGVRDARDRRLLGDPAAQTALMRRAPLRIASGADERPTRAALTQRDVGVAAAAGADDARPLPPYRRR